MAEPLRDLLVSQFESAQKRTLDTMSQIKSSQLKWLPGDRPGNPIGFLFWHMPRREDFHLQQRIQGLPEQLWQSEGWHQKAGLDPEATGFGFTPEEVRAFQVPPMELALGYYNRVREETLEYLRRPPDQHLLPNMPVP